MGKPIEVRGQSRHHRGQAPHHHFGVQRVIQQWPDRFLPNLVVVFPEGKEVWRLDAALGAPVAEDRHLAKQVAAALGLQFRSLLVAPVDRLVVTPNEHGGLTGDHSEMLPVGNLDVDFSKDRQFDTHHACNRTRHGPRCVDHDPRVDPVARGQAHPGHRASVDVYCGDFGLEKTRSALACPFEHPCPELLGAQPTGPPDMDRAYRLVRDEGEVLPNRVRADEDVGALGCSQVALLR